MRLLLIEDDEALQRSLLEALTAARYAVDAFGTAQHGLLALACVDYDVVVLDLGLPDLDGLELLRRLRDQGRRTPVLLLSARGEWTDRVKGLDLGADDYLAKPFVLEELLARLRALGRRAGEAQSAQLQLGALSLNTVEPEARWDGQALPLTPKEWTLLLALARQSPRSVAKAKLAQSLGPWDGEPSRNAIELHVSRLRQKLAATTLRLEAIRGFGYRLVNGHDA